MTKVVVELCMSLNAYVTGPEREPGRTMGRGDEAVHDWTFKGRSAAESAENAHYSGIGAVIVAPDGRSRDRSDLRGLGRQG